MVAELICYGSVLVAAADWSLDVTESAELALLVLAALFDALQSHVVELSQFGLVVDGFPPACLSARFGLYESIEFHSEGLCDWPADMTVTVR